VAHPAKKIKEGFNLRYRKARVFKSPDKLITLKQNIISKTQLKLNNDL
jgi:hypothetical protein